MTKYKEKWEDEFDGTVYRLGECATKGCYHIYDDQGNASNLQDLKAFIRTLLASQREELRGKVKGLLRRDKIELTDREIAYREGHVDTLMAVLALLEEEHE